MLNGQTSLVAAMICLSTARRVVPHPPCLSFLSPSPLPYVVPVWPADVSGLTNALTASLTLIYFLWNLGAGGNNTEWHYLFIKSKAASLGRVKMWWLDTTTPHAAHTHTLQFLIVPWLGLARVKLNLIQGNAFEIWQRREQSWRWWGEQRWRLSKAIKLSGRSFNPTTQFCGQFIKHVFCLR